MNKEGQEMVGTNSPVSVRLDVDTRARLNALANRLNCTPHALMRQAVAEFVERRSTPVPAQTPNQS
ncbi:CopG family ribbon-helix-helix protein [Martelella sp. AD-3]|uniref:CopG family ribbon-helix-helix protein n=1 Tax=Martelella TaxID=293088 RepID=UPI0009DE7AE5|nr:ribbon-helix-helix protein, CopG family [Rhizobiaceae bacterium]